MKKINNFEYVYLDEDENRYISSAKCIEIFPTFEFVVNVDNVHYTCVVDHAMSKEWKIVFFCSSQKTYCSELSNLDDVFWNTESIYTELRNYRISNAIAQAISDIYTRFKGSYRF